MPSPESAKHQTRVLAVSSGKGGVGKTNVSVNLAVALAHAGDRTLLLDADLGMANVDVLLNLTAKQTLADVLAGRCELNDIILKGPHGLGIIPAASGIHRMSELSTSEHVGLIHAFSQLDQPIDNLVIDTAAGITDSVLTFCQAAHEVIVVVCDEPTSITDAYALMKVLRNERNLDRFQILANQTRGPNEGRLLYEKLSGVAERFLDVSLNFLGAIPHDDWLRRAVQRQSAVTEVYPGSYSAQAFREVATRIRRWSVPQSPRGNVEFFLERLVATRGVAA